MTSLNYDFKDKLKRLNVFEKIIAVNIGIFFLGWVLMLIRRVPRGNTLTWLELPKDFFEFLTRPWSIITYGFTHYDFFHLLFNMLVLYFVSRTMVNIFPRKQSLNIYFLGIITGGLAYLAIYNILPERLVLANAGALVGASAGVRALLIFICAYMPYREARFFAVKIKLWYIGVALVAFDIIGLFGNNQGGNVAHLGGVLLGYLYATQLLKGKDIGEGFGRFMDKIANVFKPKSPLKTVHKNKKKPFAGHNKDEFNEFNNQKKVDLILDKISKSGYESLTKEEKTFLFKAGKD
ncbi:rhomboid family intramembrane serine protease [uncultured Psychroserpens sp.]|uniref:rhomboid family intramembrane serine protease n=1 Tax=uncultured Psychroserpens sp. TaxID=255436 RepID=UPI002609F063|nr:rhomboid family intramembrane serine protease [uncultured Psychroserpens sp.]